MNESVQVPREYVNNGEIVLNVSYDATSGLQIGNDFVEFKARFGGKPRDIHGSCGRVIAIYARENGQGMAFPLDDDVEVQPSDFAVAHGGRSRIRAEARGTVQLQSVDGKSGRADKARDKDGPARPSRPLAAVVPPSSVSSE